VFAGVRKLGVVSGVLAELSESTLSNVGTFLVLAPSGSNSYVFRSRGTLVANTAGGSFANSPDSAVVTGIGDISAPLSLLRRNAVDISTSTASQGTGNYGNYQLFIGRRGGTIDPFNGQLYTLIARGVLSSTAEIRQAEKLIAKKTSLVTLPESFDPDALDYFSRVVAAGGSFASASYSDNYTRVAINQWFVAVKDFGLWSKITEAYLFAGCTFAGVTQKLKFLTTPTLTNVGPFVSGDYTQAGALAGLRGNSSNKRLDSDVPGTELLFNDHSMALYVTQGHSVGTGRAILTLLDGSPSSVGIAANLPGDIRASINNSARTFSSDIGLQMINQRFAWTSGVKDATIFGNSFTASSAIYSIFGRATSFSNPRMTFAMLGKDLGSDANVINFSTATNALMTALGANVY